jgi:hypothetical protein
MPPAAAVVAGAALSAGLGAAAGVTLFGLTVAQTAILSFVVQVALGFLSSALAPKPKLPNLSGFDIQGTNQTQQLRQPITAWRTVYGEVRLSGAITFITTTNNNDILHMVVTIAGHPCEAIDTVYFDDVAISMLYDVDGNANVTRGKYANKARIQTDVGTVGSQPFPALASATTEWTAAHRQDGHTKIYIRLEADQDLFPKIPNVSAWIKGKKVVDPRNSSTEAWSINPALALRDYLVTPVKSTGFGATTLEIDDTFTNSAANTSDEIVSTNTVAMNVASTAVSTSHFVLEGSTTRFFTGDRVRVSTNGGSLPSGVSGGTDYYYIPEQRLGTVRGAIATSFSNAIAGTKVSIGSAGSSLKVKKTGEPRYTLNGMIESDRTGSDIIEDMLSAMGGRATFASGKWRIRAAAYESPSITLDEGDIISPIDIQTKVSRRERFNAVKGIYVTTLNLDQPTDYPPITNSTYETEDNGERKYTELDLPFTNRPHTAQRLAKIALERHRQQITVKTTFNLKAMQLTAGDTVQLTNERLGWSAKVFEVSEWQLDPVGEENPALGVQLTLRETVSDVFDWNSGLETEVDPAPNTNLPDPFTVNPPTNLTISEELYVTRNGAGVKARVTMDWDAASGTFVREYEPEYKLSSASDWTILPRVDKDQTNRTIDDFAPGTYDFRVRSVSGINVRSEYAAKYNEEIVGLSAPPTAPQNLTIQTAGGLAILRWDRSTDLDVRIGGYIYFRHSNLQSGATWVRSVTIGEALPGSETVAVLPLKAGTYLCQFVDSTGNESDISSVTTKQANAVTFTTVSTIQEDAVFLGSTTNVVVYSGTAIRLGGSALIDDIPDIDAVSNWDLAGGIVASGEYVFGNIFDFGSVQNRRITTTVSVLVYDALDTIDDRTSNIDDWGDFDGTGSASADCRVYMRQTDDDPTGSPTWGNWELVEAGDVNAWGVQLKAVLTSNDPVYNIDVYKLRATAESVA